MPPAWSITLRDERVGPDTHALSVHWFDDTGLVVDGHDLGPGTAMVADDGEYEYRYEIAIESIPELLRLLGAPADADLEATLRRFTGRRSYDFERINSGLRTNFSCWP